jgi:molybdate transport system substrate-binding protein
MRRGVKTKSKKYFPRGWIGCNQLRMRSFLRFLFALLLAAKFVGARVEGSEVMVFAAASLADVLKEIAGRYEKKAGDKVVFNFGASSMLARQIEEGAPADIFFSADEAKMDGLEKKGLIRKETRKSRLSNSLVIVVAGDSGLKIPSAKYLVNAKVKRLALAETRTVPAGIYAKEYLQKQNLWHALESKVIPTENVRAALAAVEAGNVDAGIVYKTDARISKKVRIAYEIPVGEGPVISYAMAMVKDAKQPKAAGAFLDYLAGAEAGIIFEKHGFLLRKQE